MNYDKPFLPPTETGNPRRMALPVIDPETGCWLWQGSIVGGYGKLSFKGEVSWAHRVYYEIINGPVPERHQIHHLCRNRSCVYVGHMEALSPRKHAQEGSSRTKLNLAQVREIRRRLAKGEKGAHLAREFGVIHNTICDIRSGRSWQREVTCPNCAHHFDPYEFD